MGDDVEGLAPAENGVMGDDVEGLAPAENGVSGDASASQQSCNTSEENGGTEDAQEDADDVREGTIMSARLNILATMVGGGSLSLPMAFHETGNAFVGPLFIILVAMSAEFCFRLLVVSAGMIQPTPGNATRKGNGSFESVASAAFGPRAHVFSMGLVTALCFFGTIGYAVLLRDMLEPLADFVAPPPSDTGLTLAHNVAMLIVILAVTPLCTLRTFTALQRFGAASMISILILGSCVLYRSLQCNFSADHASDRHTTWLHYLTFVPSSLKQVLNALPLFVSTFVCHYNILPVHNELRNPTPARVSWWLRSTTLFAGLFYLVIGFSGSMYGNCTPSGSVQGNVLLDFDEDDPLLLMGRLCLALTITLAFPLLVIPARDIVIHTIQGFQSETEEPQVDVNGDVQSELREALLAEENGHGPVQESSSEGQSVSLTWRLATAVLVLWTGAAVACCVTSIDVVWDLLGSSLSILLSYLIPCGSYIALTWKQDRELGWKERLQYYTAWFLVVLFVPLMFISTGNAVHNTFFHGDGEF